MTKIRRRLPVEDYLRPQKRFAHLFAGAGRPDLLALIQAQADRQIARFGLVDPTPAAAATAQAPAHARAGAR